MADLLVSVGADVRQYNQAMQQVGQTAQQTGQSVARSLGEAAMQTERLGGSALSASQRMMQMRSGISAARDGVLAFTVGGQAAERSLLAMGHHFNSLVNETGSFRGALSALGSSLWGVGGVILGLSVAAELLMKYAGNKKEASEITQHFTKDTDAENQAFKTLGNSYSESIENLDKLKINVQLAKEGLISKSGVVKEYNDTMGKAAGAVKTLDEVEQKIVKNGEAYVKMTLYKAAAQAALKEAADKAVESAKIQASPDDENAPFILSGLKGGKYDKDYKNSAQIARDERAKEYEKDQKQLENAAAILQAKAAAISKQYKLNFFDDTKTGTKKGEKTLIQSLEEQLKQLQDTEAKYVENGGIADAFNPTSLERNINAMIVKIERLKQAVKGSGEISGASGTTSLTTNGVSNINTKQGQGVDQQSGMKDAIKNLEAYIDLQGKSTVAQKNFNAATKEENQIGKDIAKTFGVGLMNAFEGVLNGTESFVDAMKNLLIGLIEKFIAAIAVAAILTEITGGSFTAASSVAGSFGANFASLSGLHLAEGGITTGPTHALIGEGGEKEAVMPLSKLNQFVNSNGNGGNLSITHKIEGSDLLLVINRAQKTQSRKS